MHRRQVRNLLPWMIAIVMVIGLVPGASFAGANDIIVTSYTSSDDDIQLNEVFTLTVTAQNSTGTVHSGNTSYMQIGGSDFVSSDGNPMVSLGAVFGANGATTKAVSLKRVGTGNSLSLTFLNNGSTIGTQTVTVTQATTYSSGGSSTPTDTTKYKPVVKVAGDGEVQSFEAGKVIELDIPLVNDASYTAKNVEIAFENSTKDLPFLIENAKLVGSAEKVTKKEGGTGRFNLTVSPLAKSKIYELKLKLTYQNSWGDSFSSTDKYYIKIENGGVEPILGVTDYRFVGETCVAGVEDAILLTIANKGTLEARDIRVTIDGFSKDGLRLIKDVDTKAIDLIKAKDEDSVYFKFLPAPTAKSGVYELTAKMTYIDAVGNEYEKTSTMYVNVEGKDSSAIDMEVRNVQAPGSVVSGDEFTVSFDFENKTPIEADWVEVSVTYPGDFAATSAPKKVIREVKQGDVHSMTFDFLAKSDIQTGHNDFFITLRYKTEGESEADAKERKEYVGISSKGSAGLGRPKIMIKNYDFGGESVMAGEEFDITLSLYNTNADEMVKNIKVSISSDDGVFSPVDSSSSFFVEKIGRQETVDYVLRLKTKRDAQVKAYNLNLKMEYEDGKGNAYDSQKKPFQEEESIGINVSQPIRLEVSDPMVPFDATVGRPTDIEVEFYNMGRAPMANMFVKLEGDFPTQNASYFVGNFESGNSNYFAGTVIPAQEGELQGEIVFTFEDALGNPSEVRKPFSMFISAGSGGESFPGEDFGEGELGPMPGDLGPEGEGQGNQKWMYILGGLGLVAVIGFVVWRRRKKKAQLLMELEDDDE